MQDRRIFIALDISDAARAVCGAHIASLRQKFPDVRIGWERPEKLHITLKFLGRTDADVLEKLKGKISEAAARERSFGLRLSKTGVFPSNTRPRIFWIGTDDPSGAVEPLYEQIETECHSLGFEREGRQFRPHITIGRVREARGAAGVAGAHLETKIEPAEFEVADIVIYESKLQPTGSIYSVVSRAGLGRQP